MKKILFVEKAGQYNVIGLMLIHIADAFQKLGYAVEIAHYEYLKKIDFQIKADYIFSINGFLGDGTFSEILKKINSKWITLLVDSPYYHTQTLDYVTDKFIPVSIDKAHQEIIKNVFYHKNALFMPFGAPENIFQEMKDINTRKIPIAFFGSLGSKNEWRNRALEYFNNLTILVEYLENKLNEYAEKYKLIYTDLLFEEIKTDFFKIISIAENEKFLLEIKLYHIVDSYFRMNNRLNILNALKDMALAIFGNINPEDFEKNKFVINKNLPFDKTLMFMANTAVVLTISPSMIYSMSERLTYSMSLGNIIVADTNNYIAENFNDQKIGYFFNSDDLANLKEKIQNILANPKLKKEYSEFARSEFLKNHTWTIRIK
ncbi:MAG TPA: glycosyltransferase [bacterium]|mgnify:FL=1|nr:glycosyltransferase [bacterium]